MELNKTEKIFTIKGISIPIYGYPLISQGSYEEMLKTYFFGKEVNYIILNKTDYMVVSLYYFNNYTYLNYLATALYRCFKPSEQSQQDCVYGPALIIGKDEIPGQYTSVSQQTIESVLNIFTRDLYAIKDVPQ